MEPRILRMPDLSRYLGISKATIYRLLNRRRFPKPIKLGPRAVGWKITDVDEWIATRDDG